MRSQETAGAFRMMGAADLLSAALRIDALYVRVPMASPPPPHLHFRSVYSGSLCADRKDRTEAL